LTFRFCLIKHYRIQIDEKKMNDKKGKDLFVYGPRIISLYRNFFVTQQKSLLAKHLGVSKVELESN